MPEPPGPMDAARPAAPVAKGAGWRCAHRRKEWPDRRHRISPWRYLSKSAPAGRPQSEQLSVRLREFQGQRTVGSCTLGCRHFSVSFAGQSVMRVMCQAPQLPRGWLHGNTVVGRHKRKMHVTKTMEIHTSLMENEESTENQASPLSELQLTSLHALPRSQNQVQRTSRLTAKLLERRAN